MCLTLKLILLVWAVVLLGGALYIFANEKGLIHGNNKKTTKTQDEA